MKLLGTAKSKITNAKNAENGPHLEINEVILVYCNIGSNDFQQDLRVNSVLFLINLLLNYQIFYPKNFIFLKTFDSEFSYVELWFTDQNCKALEIEDKINITLVIN